MNHYTPEWCKISLSRKVTARGIALAVGVQLFMKNWDSRNVTPASRENLDPTGGWPSLDCVGATIKIESALQMTNPNFSDC
jgi:hypothetical protein